MTPEQIIKKRRELWEQYHDIEKDKEFTKAVADYIVSDEGEEIRKAIANRPAYLIEMVMVVVDKEGQTVPFFFNDVQQDFINDLYQAKEDYRQGKRNHLNFLLLKGRQQGFTTVITADQLANAIVTKNFTGYTMANEDDNTTTIFEDKAKFPLDNLPDPIKPTEKYNNRRELHFEKLNSRWRVATAGKDKARSKTLKYFHGSEAAFWKFIQKMMAGLGNSLTKDSIKILETTANGYNEYKDLWDGAISKENNWTPLFYEWWRTPEYRLNFESERKEREFKSNINSSTDWIFQRCKWLIEVIKLDWQQVYWYYNKWLDQGELIKQEFPCSADEAFLASGRCVFDKEKIVEHKEYLKRLYAENKPIRGEFQFKWNDPETKDKILDDSIKFIEKKDGVITIYEDVQRGYPYVIGGDTKGEGKDFFAGTVINNATGKRCATLHAQLSNSKPYTWQMYCLGKYFNTALIGIEMNFNTAPIEELERLRYPKQYTRQQYDSFTKEYQKKYGWKTDGNTRPLIIDKEVDLIENNIDLFTDITFLDECLSFIYDENNRPDAEEGKHDDVLFSDMIANEIRSQQRFTVNEEPEPKKLKLLEKLGIKETPDIKTF